MNERLRRKIEALLGERLDIEEKLRRMMMEPDGYSPETIRAELDDLIAKGLVEESGEIVRLTGRGIALAKIQRDR